MSDSSDSKSQKNTILKTIFHKEQTYENGKVSAFEGFDEGAQPNLSGAMDVLGSMRLASRDTSPEKKNALKTQNGIEMLDVYFKDIFDYLSNANYGY